MDIPKFSLSPPQREALAALHALYHRHAQSIVAVSPIVLPRPERGADLSLRISAPRTGRDLPLLIFSHGNGGSMHSYHPLTDDWAAHGFVVIQPTFLDSNTLALPKDDPRQQRIWLQRYEDVQRVLDQLDEIEVLVPEIKGRVDHSRIAVAGHSWGAQTSSLFLGARVLKDGGSYGDMSDARVKAGLMLAPAGLAGTHRTPFATTYLPFMNPSFETLRTPTMVVAGENDVMAPLTTRGADWAADPYHLSPGGESLLTVFGAQHLLGGITSYESTGTGDENPVAVATIQFLTTAFLKSVLDAHDDSYALALAAFAQLRHPAGTIDNKRARQIG